MAGASFLNPTTTMTTVQHHYELYINNMNNNNNHHDIHANITANASLSSISGSNNNNMHQEPLSAEDNVTLMRLNDAQQGIYSSYIWIIFVLGFPGNVACVATVLSMTTLSTATLYVALLAVVDALALLLKLIFHQLTYHRVYFGDAGCKIQNVSMIVNVYANWVLVLVCFERFLAVSWPLKKAVFFTKSRATLIAGALLGIIFLIYAQLFFLSISDDTGMFCGYDADVTDYMKVWHWFSVVLFSFAPFILIVIFTTLIITGLRKYRAARKSILRGDHHHHHHHHHNNQHNGKWDNKRSGAGGGGGGAGDGGGGNTGSSSASSSTTSVECAISVMMTVAAIVFLVLTLPTCIFVLAYDHGSEYPRVENARWMLFQQVTFILSDFNHAVNFYLYFLTADKFRTQFKELVMCRPRKSLRKKSDATSVGDHTMYTRANSTENLAMTRV